MTSVKFVKHVVVGQKVSLNFKLLGKYSSTTVELANEQCAVSLCLSIIHLDFLETTVVLDYSHSHAV